MKKNYKSYLENKKIKKDYNDYQSKYEDEPRESDKKIIEIISRKYNKNSVFKVLDFGCSTGNLLKHILFHFPKAQICGYDLSDSAVKLCKKNFNEKFIFEVKNIINFKPRDQFDVIIVNAVLFLFDWRDFKISINNIYKSLNNNGIFISFEWYHPFDLQDITIKETSMYHPKGLTIHNRPQKMVNDILINTGFKNVNFEDFEIGINLPKTKRNEEVSSYTIKTEQGKNLLFRGALSQPWSHMIARK